MTMIYEAPAPSTHSCVPTGRTNYTVGSIWRCDCGNYLRYWRDNSDDYGPPYRWRFISLRKARRLQRKLGIGVYE